MGVINGIPITWGDDEQLLGSLFPKKDINLQKPITNNAPKFPTYNSPLGEKSIFADPCDENCEYAPEFISSITGGVDIVQLAKDLNTGSRESFALERNKFNYARYLTHKSRMSPAIGDLGPVVVGANTEIEYTDAQSKNQFTNTTALLNKVECCVNTIPFLSVLITPSKCSYNLFYVYRGTEENIKAVIDNDNKSKYSEERKYIAIDLTFKKGDEMAAFLANATTDAVRLAFENTIISKFNKALQSAEKDPGQLNLLYQNIPWFVVKDIAREFNGQRLFNHLSILLDYDDKGRWSGFRDSSNAVINLMKGFPDPASLYQGFLQDPALVKRIYNDMNGKSVVDELEIPNRSIFCSFLCSLCASADSGVLIAGNKTFLYGKGYKLDSNINPRHDKDPQKIFLQQVITSTETLPPDLDGDMDSYQPKPFLPSVFPEKTDKEDDRYFHPLDIVGLMDTETRSVYYVPAIFVKDLSDQQEQIEINRRLRIGIDIFVVIFSLILLKRVPGSSLFRTGLAIDATGGIVDMLITGYEEELKKTKAGQEFLQAWSGLLATYGVINGTAALAIAAKGVFSSGAKLLTTLKNGSARNFVMGVLTSLIIDVNITNFIKASPRILETAEVYTVLKTTSITTGQITRLQLAGVLFVSATQTTGAGVKTGIMVVYKAQVIARGTAGEVKETMKDIFKTTGSTLEGVLDELWNMTPKVNGKYLEAINKAGNKMRWLNQIGNPNVNLKQEITRAIGAKGGKVWEGIVAKEFNKYDDITQFRSDVENMSTMNIAGDLDVANRKYLIECKENISKNSLEAGKSQNRLLAQFDKYLNPQNPNYINLENKQVVLVTNGLKKGVTLSHPILRKLKKAGVIIITDLKQIQKLY